MKVNKQYRVLQVQSMLEFRSVLLFTSAPCRIILWKDQQDFGSVWYGRQHATAHQMRSNVLNDWQTVISVLETNHLHNLHMLLSMLQLNIIQMKVNTNHRWLSWVTTRFIMFSLGLWIDGRAELKSKCLDWPIMYAGSVCLRFLARPAPPLVTKKDVLKLHCAIRGLQPHCDAILNSQKL